MTLKAGEGGPAGVHRTWRARVSSLGFPFALHTPSTGKASNQKCQWAQKKEGKVNKGLLSLAKEPGKEQKLPSSNSSTEGAQQLAGHKSLGRQESWECFRSKGWWNGWDGLNRKLGMLTGFLACSWQLKHLRALKKIHMLTVPGDSQFLSVFFHNLQMILRCNKC